MLGYLAAISGILSILWKVLQLILPMFKKDPAKAIADTHEVIEQLKAAKTPEEKIAAAKRIQELIHGS